MRKKTAIVAILATFLSFIGRNLTPSAGGVAAVAGSGPNLTINYLSGTTATGGWADTTPATIGETVEFYVEIHNTNVPSTAKNLTVKIDLPATPTNGTITTTANASTTTQTTVSGSQTNVSDSTSIVGLPADALLRYQTGSLRITADLDGDGNNDYNDSTWPNDNLTTVGINLGDLEGGQPALIQLSFKAQVIRGGAPNLTVKHLSANPQNASAGWSDATPAAPGDSLQFYIEIHNTQVLSVANNLTVRVDLPAGEGESLSSLATVDAASATAQADGTAVNFSERARWRVRSLSTRITWDSNGDGVLDMNGSIWPNDDLFSPNGLNLGELWGCNPFIIQLSFWVDTEAAPAPPEEPTPSAPRLTIEKKVIFSGREYDNVSREVHLYDPGEEVEYRLIVTNSGEQEATGVAVVDQLPAYIRSLDGFDKFEFAVGSVAAGASWSTNYKAKVVEQLPQNDRTQVNTATVSSDNAGSDSDSAFVWINGPEILAAKAEAAAEAAPAAETEQLPVTGPALPVAAGLAGMLPVGVWLRRRFV